MLGDLFSSCGPRPPFPELEALSVGWLWASEPTPPGCADACEKLAHALEDRSRCPLLQRLNVSVSINRTMREVSTAQGEDEEEVVVVAAAQESILRSYFERVASGGVQLQVDISVA